MHMSTCAICLDALKSPTAFPCGHVFCFTCIESTVHKHSPLACTQCPTCRTSFPLVTVNPALLPLHLRPFFQPPFRRLYLDNHTVPPRINRASPPNSPPTLHAEASTSAPVPVRTCEGAVEIARLRAELEAVRAQGTMWQRRAELLASVVGNAVRESVHTEVQRLRREGESVRSEELTRRMHALEAAEPGLTMHKHENNPTSPASIESPRDCRKHARDSDDESEPESKRIRCSSAETSSAPESREHTPLVPPPTDAELAAATSLRMLSVSSPSASSVTSPVPETVNMDAPAAACVAAAVGA